MKQYPKELVNEVVAWLKQADCYDFPLLANKILQALDDHGALKELPEPPKAKEYWINPRAVEKTPGLLEYNPHESYGYVHVREVLEGEEE